MTSDYVLDAHSLIWQLEDNPKLGPNARNAFDDPNARLFLPIIALVEACWTVNRGVTNISSVESMLSDVDADARIHVIPLDRTVLDLYIALPQIGEMHDRLIVATTQRISALYGECVLLTRDENIADSGAVTTLW